MTMHWSVPATVMKVLSSLSPKLDNTLLALLMANIITPILANHLTDLQVSLVLHLRESKELVKTMSNFWVTCIYDELLHFKKSVVSQAAKSADVTAISNVEDGLVQVVVDNFDAKIAFQNDKLSNHSLAVLVTQPDADTQEVNKSKATFVSEQVLVCGPHKLGNLGWHVLISFHHYHQHRKFSWKMSRKLFCRHSCGKKALQLCPQNLDARDYGWTKDVLRRWIFGITSEVIEANYTCEHTTST